MHKPRGMMAHGVMCEPNFPCFGSLTCPLQQDAITSIPQVVFASTCASGCVFISLVWILDQTRINAAMLSRPYCDISAVFPQIWRSARRLWFHIGFIWSCSRFFPLISPYRKKGNNGRRSPKGERLRMSVGSVRKSLYALHSKMQWSPAKIMSRSQGQKWKKIISRFVHN